MQTPSKESRLLTLIVALSVIAALYLGRDVLIPFALAALVSFLLHPLVERMQRLGLHRIVAVALAMALLLAGASTLGWIVASGARDLANKLPEYQVNIQQKTRVMREIIQRPVERATNTVKDLGEDEPVAKAKEHQKEAAPAVVRLADSKAGPVEMLSNVFGPVFAGGTVLAMALLVAIIMLLRPEDLRDRIIRLIGHGKISLTTQAFDEASNRVSVYLGRLLLVNGILGVGLATALLIIGIPNALLWGLLLTCLRFVPYVGLWIAAMFPLVISLATSSGWSQPLEILGVFVALELLANLALEPWLFSAGTGISPLAVLLSALFWSWLWGPIGLILATPLTVCLVVLGKYVPQLHFIYLLFSDAQALPPAARIYQRLLAQDHDEAWSILKLESSEKTLPEVFDTLLLPVLALSETDRKKGTLDEESALRVQEGTQLLIDECGEPASVGPTAGEPPLPNLSELRVLCLPARNSADALAAEMLDRVLRRSNAASEVASLAEFVGETIDSFKSRPADVVVVSAVPPSRLMHVRYICKRLALHDPDLEVIVAMWGSNLEDPLVAERLPKNAKVHVVDSLNAVLASLSQVEPHARIRRQASEPGLANAG